MPALEPGITGWLAFEGTDDLTRLTQYDETLRADARRFELMTLPYQDFAGFNGSLELLLSLGMEHIREHMPHAASAGARLGGAERRQDHLAAGSRGSGILCVAPEGVQEVHRRLKAARIVCSLREGSIRFSPHCFNTVAEMERVAQTLAGD